MSPDNNNGSNVWPMVLEKLNTIVTAHGGSAILQNGSLILEMSSGDDDLRRGIDVLDELYEKIPGDIKDRHRLLPYWAHYFL